METKPVNRMGPLTSNKWSNCHLNIL